MKIKDIINKELELLTRWQFEAGDIEHQQKLYKEWETFREMEIN